MCGHSAEVAGHAKLLACEVVAQEPLVFSESIKYNICFGVHRQVTQVRLVSGLGCSFKGPVSGSNWGGLRSAVMRMLYVYGFISGSPQAFASHLVRQA